MKRSKRGFSVLEVISAVVILTVVTAAAVATVAPMRKKANDLQVQNEIAELNSLSQDFFNREGYFPKNVNELVRTGFLPSDAPDAAERIRGIRRNYRYSPTSGTFAQR